MKMSETFAAFTRWLSRLLGINRQPADPSARFEEFFGRSHR